MESFTVTNGLAPQFGNDDLALADADGDGRLDALIAWKGISCWRGDGFGGFQQAQHSGGGEAWTGLAVGDFTGDGAVDAAGFQHVLAELGLAHGHGDGTFAAPLAVASAGATILLRADDANLDGSLDLVAFQPFRIDAYLGDGVGHFAAPIATSAPVPATYSIEVADVTSDGRADVVFGAVSAGQVQLRVRAGDGSGAFPAEQALALAATPSASNVFDLALEDVDGDGARDVAVALFSTAAAPVPALAVVRADGAGGFHAPALGFGPARSVHVALADDDGDGDLDLFLAPLDLPEWARYRNDAGVFAPFETRALPVATGPVLAADVDGDLARELVVHVPYGVAVVRNTAPLEVTKVQALPLDSVVCGAGDSTGDGRPDVQVVLRMPAGRAEIWRGDGALGFQPAASMALPFAPGIDMAQHAFDATEDGVPDFVAAGPPLSHAVAIVRGTTAGGLAAPQLLSLAGDSRSRPAQGDFDGDGDADLTFNADPFLATVYRSGTAFAPGPTALLPFPALADSVDGVGAGDLDNDGDLDLAVLGTRLWAATFLPAFGTGTGAFQPGAELTVQVAARGSVVVRAEDLDADGISDVALMVTGPVQHDLQLLRLFGSGGGAFGAPVASDPGPADSSLLQFATDADLNGDGRLDLVYAHSYEATFTWLERDGGSGFLAPRRFSLGAVPTGIATADFDGDGGLEVVSGGDLLAIAARACAGDTGTYGTGCPGSGGFTPALGASGCPVAGGVVELRLAHALGGSQALLALGLGLAPVPRGGICALYPAPLAPALPVLPLSGAGAGAGGFLLAAAVPQGVAGIDLAVQALVADSASFSGFSASNAAIVRLR